MLTIAPDQVTPAILALFDLDKPTLPRAFNVLEGLTQGQILVEDASQPTWAVVREGAYGTLYIGGEIDASPLAEIVQSFREVGEVGIGCWLNDPLNEMIPPHSDYDGRTLYFTERSSNSNITCALPSGYTLALRDEHLFSKASDYESTLAAFGSVEKALQYTKGVMILHDDFVVCEAATGAPTHQRIEIGVTTTESYRRKGFGTTACARLIEICEGEGYRTWWDCVKQNIASANLARKLGYRNEREYRYVWWMKKGS